MSKKHEVAATIYDKRGRILSVGRNSYVKTHPFQARLAKRTGNPAKEYLHAEISALVRCRSVREPYRILVTRYGHGGIPRNARPCEICALAIREAGIKVVEHT